jgi:hypothetical protein
MKAAVVTVLLCLTTFIFALAPYHTTTHFTELPMW